MNEITKAKTFIYMWEQNWSDSQGVPLKYKNNKERKTKKNCTEMVVISYINVAQYESRIKKFHVVRSLCLFVFARCFVHSSVQFALQSCLLFSTFTYVRLQQN